MTPVQIQIRDKKYLHIKWDDNTESLIKLANLRRYCPCAVCNAEREEQGPDYIPIYNTVQVTIKDIKVIGYYALNIKWEDGHSTGIYEYERLKGLGTEKSQGN